VTSIADAALTPAEAGSSVPSLTAAGLAYLAGYHRALLVLAAATAAGAVASLMRNPPPTG
jgi:hypothetical protein